MNITDFRDKHKGQTCYILGNGPSLNDVKYLQGLDCPTFGSNRIYLSGYEPDYYACVNPLVLEQFGNEIAGMKSIKFLNKPYAAQMGGVEIDTSLDVPSFENPEGPMWEGHTVTYVLMQLAFYMGFESVRLLGVDHDYGDKGKVPNLELIATGADPYHFSSEYFSQGTRWNAPDLAMSELAYSLAKQAFEGTGREILNCSANTKLNVFPVQPFRHRFLSPRVSAIVSAYKCPVDWLKACIDDIDAQMENAEIVVVCQEGSEHHGLVRDLRHVITVTTKDIPTVYRAWNLGIKQASGRYITNCNTDDRRHALSMQLMADVLDARPEVDIVYHDQYITWETPKTYREFMEGLEQSGERLLPGRVEGKPGAFVWTEHSLEALGQGCYLGPQPMWRANLHQKHGYFLESYKSAGDYEFWLRVAKEDNFFHIGAALGVYCARSTGIELNNPKLSLEESQRALMINQEPGGIEYTPLGGYIKAELGGKRAFVRAAELFELMERLKKAYTEAV